MRCAYEVITPPPGRVADEGGGGVAGIKYTTNFGVLGPNTCPFEWKTEEGMTAGWWHELARGPANHPPPPSLPVQRRA